ncbi:MAG: hypothetical protein CL424_08725 [Acidimicrobiaceae bacterium]|nr:hypothetical protein [Acidimicrobiaceae bacterium]
MKVLLVEGQTDAAAAAERELREHGHTIERCTPHDRSAPCRGLEPLGECPLDSGDIDVAVVGRMGGPLAADERGALCAARYRVPVVVAGNPRDAVSFGPGTHLAPTDLIGACERAAQSGDAHVAAIRRELLMAGVVTPADVDVDDPPVWFAVRREPRRLRLEVHVPDGDPRLASIVKAAGHAIRNFDQHTPVIDVIAARS